MMTAQQLNATISMIAEADADYAGDYMALLAVICPRHCSLFKDWKSTGLPLSKVIP